MDRELQYVLFMAERSIEDARNMAYIQECLVLVEGTNVVERIAAINEGVVDKAKAAWAKVREWIKNVWAKFTEKFNKLAMDDAAYLKEYRDIIFNKKPVDANYTMIDYPTAVYRCTQIKVPKLNYAAMKNDLDPEDHGKFLKTIIKDYDGRTNPSDYIRTYFKGGSDDAQSIHVSKLKFADMYDFCVDYKKIHSIVENDKKAIEASYTEAEKAINALNIAPEPGETKQESAIDRFFGKDQVVFSRVHERYITEADGDREVTNKGTGTTSPTTPQPQTGHKASENISNTTGTEKKEDDNKTVDQRTKETQDQVAKNDDGSTTKAAADEAIAKIGVYNSIATAIMSAKLSAVEGAQKTYMKILRTHIKDHVGNKESESGNNSGRTDYRTPYDKSSEANKKAIDDWAMKTIKMSIKDLQTKISNGETIDRATLDAINSRSVDIIKYIGQANFDKISTASAK